MPGPVIAAAALGTSVAFQGAQIGVQAGAAEEQRRLTEQGTYEKFAYILRAEHDDIEDQIRDLSSLTATVDQRYAATGLADSAGGGIRAESIARTRRNIARLRLNTEQARVSLGLAPGQFEHRLASIHGSQHEVNKIAALWPQMNEGTKFRVMSENMRHFEWAADGTNSYIINAAQRAGLPQQWSPGQSHVSVRHRGLG